MSTPSPDLTKPLLVSRREAARLLGGVDLSTIRRLELDGQLRPIRLNKRSPTARVYFRYQEVVALAK
jgi:hypothetical protein